jgi:hypothetical protein
MKFSEINNDLFKKLTVEKDTTKQNEIIKAIHEINLIESDLRKVMLDLYMLDIFDIRKICETFEIDYDVEIERVMKEKDYFKEFYEHDYFNASFVLLKNGDENK